MKILVIEDDPTITSTLQSGLTSAGYTVEHLSNGATALDRISSHPFNAVIMDHAIRGLDGITMVRALRKKTNSTPILILSAEGNAEQRISGLNAGADDFMSKPFVMDEVLARINAITRRGGEARAILVRVADLQLDMQSRKALRGNRTIKLSSREFFLLEMLMRNVNQPCSRAMLLDEVWGLDEETGTNLVDVYIRKLRSKIDIGFPRQLLQTVRGVGYIIRE